MADQRGNLESIEGTFEPLRPPLRSASSELQAGSNRVRLASMRIVWIAVGGAAGSVARYLLSSWILSISGPGFPLGTLLVNLIGSFLLGGLMELGLATDLISPTLRVTLAIGVLGGFTTYSSFNYETMQLLERGAWLIAVLNVVTTLLVCLAGGFGGVMLARWAIAVR